MFDIVEKTEKNVLSTKITGKLTKEDYKQMYPLIEETVDKFGKIKLFVELENFEGWGDPQSVWHELKVDTKYFKDLEKVAIVGEEKWEEIATKGANFVNPADIRYFTQDQKEEAQNWLYS